MVSKYLSQKLLVNSLQDLYKTHGSYRKVAKLSSTSLSTVYRLITKKNLSKIHKKRGRHTVITELDIKNISRYLKRNIFPNIKKMHNDLNLTFSTKTLKRYLIKNNYYYRKIKYKPYISNKNMEKRIKFASTHISKSDLWGTVIFTDEKKFNLKGPDGNSKVGTQNIPNSTHANELYISKSQLTDSLMVFGAFSIAGPSVFFKLKAA